MHQIMWARWAEVAVDHELIAREAFAGIVANPESDTILRDFRASLVAITGAAYAIEAMYGDIKYLIPEQPRRDSRDLVLWHAFTQGFGIPAPASHRFLADLRWLFALRDHAAHPYTEAEPPEQHPAGVTTGAETSRFNAVTSGRAVELMVELFGCAAAPPAAFNRWIERWVEERHPYHLALAPLLARRGEVPLEVRSGPAIAAAQ